MAAVLGVLDPGHDRQSQFRPSSPPLPVGLAATVGVHDRREGRSDGDGVIERGHRQGRLHPRIKRVADDSVGVGVLNGAEVKLALVGAVLGRSARARPDDRVELAVNQMVVDRRAVLSVQAAFLNEDRPDAFVRAQSGDLVLAGDDAACGEFIGDDAVAEGGVVGVNGEGGIDEMCTVSVPSCQGGFAPLAERLGGESKYPAGHRDGDTVCGRTRTCGYIILVDVPG